MRVSEVLVHVVTGFVIFIVIALSAVGLDRGMVWLTIWGLPSFIVFGLRMVEYSVFLFDLFLILMFLAETIVAILWPWRVGLVPPAAPVPPAPSARPSGDA